MDKNQIIQKLKTIKPVLQEKYGVYELALFGSYSRDEQTAASDIDIMVAYKKKWGCSFWIWFMIWIIYLINKFR